MEKRQKVLYYHQILRFRPKSAVTGSVLQKRRFWTSFRDPKRVENRSKRRSEIGSKMERVPDAIFVDFGTILAPKTPPKIVQKSFRIALLSHSGRNPELRRLQGANLDGFGTLRDRFWTSSGRFRDVSGTISGRFLGGNRRFQSVVWQDFGTVALLATRLRGTKKSTASEHPKFKEPASQTRANPRKASNRF